MCFRSRPRLIVTCVLELKFNGAAMKVNASSNDILLLLLLLLLLLPTLVRDVDVNAANVCAIPAKNSTPTHSCRNSERQTSSQAITLTRQLCHCVTEEVVFAQDTTVLKSAPQKSLSAASKCASRSLGTT